MKIVLTLGHALFVHGMVKDMRLFRTVKSESRVEFNHTLVLADGFQWLALKRRGGTIFGD